MKSLFTHREWGIGGWIKRKNMLSKLNFIATTMSFACKERVKLRLNPLDSFLAQCSLIEWIEIKHFYSKLKRKEREDRNNNKCLS